MKKKATIKAIIVYKFYSLLGHISRLLLNMFSMGSLNKSRKVSDINLLFFAGKKAARMLKPALLSIYRRWDEIPRVTIVTDGTPPEYISGYMKFWPFPYEIKPWSQVAQYHRERGRTSLLKFCDNMVFGKKMAAILAEGELKPTLYCDTDVLWFSEPTLPDYTSRALTFRMATDNVHSYDVEFVKTHHEEKMFEDKPLNAGVIFISGSLYNTSGFFDRIIDSLQYYTKGPAEQAAFAMIARKFGDTWSLEDIMLTTEDIHWPVIPRYFYHCYDRLFARHHVLTKNSWFWRDALYLFLFKRKKINKPHGE